MPALRRSEIRKVPVFASSSAAKYSRWIAITKASAMTSRKSGLEIREISPGLLVYPKSIRTVGAVVNRSKSHVFAWVRQFAKSVRAQIYRCTNDANLSPTME